MRGFFVYLLFFFLVAISIAQSPVKSFNFSINRNNILPQIPDVNYVNEGFFNSYNFVTLFNQRHKTKKDSLLPNHYTGFQLIYTYPFSRSGNVLRLEVLDKILLLNPFNRFRIFARVGYGVGLAEKVGNTESDPFNIVLTNHLNVSASARIQLSINTYKSWNCNFETGISHLSNGGTVIPNAGLNTLYLGLGIDYAFSEYTIKESSFDNDNEKRISYQIGLHASRAKIENFQWIGGGMFYLKYRMNQVNSLLLGTDFTIDGARIEERRFWSNDFRNSDLSYIYGGLAIGLEIDFKVVRFQGTLGTYLFNQDVANVMSYSNIRVIRKIKKMPINVFVGTRTSGFTAKFMEFGFVYDF